MNDATEETKDALIEELALQLKRAIEEIEYLYKHISYEENYPLISYSDSVHKPYKEWYPWMPEEFKYHWSKWIGKSVDEIFLQHEKGVISKEYVSYILRVPMLELTESISAWNKQKKDQDES